MPGAGGRGPFAAAHGTARIDDWCLFVGKLVGSGCSGLLGEMASGEDGGVATSVVDGGGGWRG